MNYFHSGLAQVERKTVWIWYLTNLFFAFAIVAPLALAAGVFLGASMESKRLFNDLDMSWVVEFAYNGRYEQFIAWLPAGAILGAVFLPVTTFLSGGTLASLEDPKESFFAGALRWFGPFFRLMLLSLFLYASVIAIRMQIDRLFALIFKDSMTARPSAIEHFLSFCLLVAMLCAVNCIFDYAKIHMVISGQRRAWQAFVEARHFVFFRHSATMKLYFTLFFCGLLMLAVYHVWSEAIGQGSGAGAFVVFGFRQLYMYFRMRLRIAFLSSQRLLMKALQPGPPQDFSDQDFSDDDFNYD